MTTLKYSWIAAVALAIVACKSTPEAPPAEAAGIIADRLMAGDTGGAEDMFDDIEDSDEHREITFAVLYEHAQGRYETRDYKSAVVILRFLVEHYPKARSPKEALLYAYMLDRARDGTMPDEEVLEQMDRLSDQLRKNDAPVWVELVSAQTAADRKDWADARAHLSSFQKRWDGSPATLRAYTVEIERYVATNEGGSR